METHTSPSVLTPLQRVRAILIEELGLSPEEIQLDTKFRDIADSLETAQLVNDLEDALGIELELDKLFTVEDVCKLL